LKLHRALLRQFQDQAAVVARRAARAVEVDDVQPVGAVAAVLGKQGAGVGIVAGFGIEVAMQQPHAVSAAQVDGWYQTHGPQSL
jgi:hypothetical protein